MQEKLKNASPVNFIKPFGPKIASGENYNEKDDITDQRAPVNNIEDLYDQFVVPLDVMEEMESETLQDFENDVYDYDDRSEYGEDVAAASQIDLSKELDNSRSKRIKNEGSSENLDAVKPDEDVAA